MNVNESEDAPLHHMVCARQHWLPRNSWNDLKKSNQKNTTVQTPAFLISRGRSLKHLSHFVRVSKRPRQRRWNLEATIWTANVRLFANSVSTVKKKGKWTAYWTVSITTRLLMKTASYSRRNPSEKDTLVSFHNKCVSASRVAPFFLIISLSAPR